MPGVGEMDPYLVSTTGRQADEGRRRSRGRPPRRVKCQGMESERDRYLDLLGKCLTASLYDESAWRIVERPRTDTLAGFDMRTPASMSIASRP